MKQPFFSLITVCYNSESTIRDTVESIKKQSFTDYEYIIIDGLSKDNTCSIIKEEAIGFPQLMWISEKDSGIYNAMNKGLKLAKGKYIWLINSDDWICDNALDDVYKFICSSDGESIVCGWMNNVDNSGVVQSVSKCNINTFLKGISKLKLGISHPATIVPKTVYDRIGLFDENYYITADVDFILRAYFKGTNFVFYEAVLSNMRNTGISNQMPFRKYYHDWKIRYNRFSTSRMQYYRLLSESVAVLFVRKALPNKVFYYLVKRRNRNILP